MEKGGILTSSKGFEKKNEDAMQALIRNNCIQASKADTPSRWEAERSSILNSAEWFRRVEAWQSSSRCCRCRRRSTSACGVLDVVEEGKG